MQVRQGGATGGPDLTRGGHAGTVQGEQGQSILCLRRLKNGVCCRFQIQALYIFLTPSAPQQFPEICRDQAQKPWWIVGRVQFSWVNFSRLASRLRRSDRPCQDSVVKNHHCRGALSEISDVQTSTDLQRFLEIHGYSCWYLEILGDSWETLEFLGYLGKVQCNDFAVLTPPPLTLCKKGHIWSTKLCEKSTSDECRLPKKKGWKSAPSSLDLGKSSCAQYACFANF